MTSILKRVKESLTSTITQKPKQEAQPSGFPRHNKPVKAIYESNPIAIPDDFLVIDPPDAKPVTITPIDWKSTDVPEYDHHVAYILENVLSPSECTALLTLAEQSVAPASQGPEGSPWRRAMVNMSAGWEVHTPHYRNGDRLIWDRQEVVDRIWARCLRAQGLGDGMAAAAKDPVVVGSGKFELRREEGSRFVFARLNHRMRFLKYSGGEFFRPHRDASYGETTVDGKYQESLFTLHLYLNDSKAAAEDPDSVELVGGSTPFLSRDEKRRVDVHCKAGRVLIFQQRGLLHSGDDVLQGVKYTMRTDIMFELVKDDDEANKQEGEPEGKLEDSRPAKGNEE
ncbi:prolyl 3-hydroxylase 2 [Echria macrotheca]|uniref:Prolyl 3-hydroxylase 2 n=1 Tax=Echria macrotheca TaxID=438768 RepID=A0AAJ0BLQ1_9PEZI|nr:prolyl 3-hydroxylase 2 [Echria macrotheca]